ncbi:tetratricopeptide repeat protein [Candidatus Micrarchaeota archaeon]|nr:tetratricopeptide repeat protein [Candidatus Micrarchaeota archaeon]
MNEDVEELKDGENPVDCRTYYRRGNVFLEKNDFDKAIEYYNTALVLNPGFAEAYYNRGLCYYQMREFDVAIKEFGKAIEFSPLDSKIYVNRGIAYYRKLCFVKAIADFDEAVSLNPSYSKAYYNRGLARGCLQEYKEALKDFDKTIELDSNYVEAYFMRGSVFEALGEYEKALKDFEKTLELNSSHSGAEAKRKLVKLELNKKTRGASESKNAEKLEREGVFFQSEKKSFTEALETPATRFSDVGGMSELKEALRELIIFPLQDAELAESYGKKAGGSVLLYGPPGCGKTFIAQAVAGEANAKLVSAKLSDLLDMYVGNSEKNIHTLFETAKQNTPAILFLDEVEALTGCKTDSGRWERSIINQLLEELDELDKTHSRVLVIGASNAPWLIDPAFKRSGRFDELVYVGPPDECAREEILKIHSRGMPVSENVDFALLARETNGFSCADVKTLCKQAASIPWREALQNKTKRKR